MRQLIIFISIFIFLHSGMAQQHSQLSVLLREYVHNGNVNYQKLKDDSRLDTYIHWLSITNPDTLPSDNAKLAFWYNAYNAYTLKLICDNYPVKSINDLHTGGLILGSVLSTTAWDKDFVVINRKKLTLNTIEHKIVRPVFKDPRSHFALVCASKSCPPLRNEAYEAETISEQLQDQGKQFLRNKFWNSFDLKNRRASLSKIFSWYSDDFGGSDEKILLFIAPFLPSEIANDIQKNVKKWRIDYLEYDWTLNE